MARSKINYNLCTAMITCDGADIPPRMTVCSSCQEKIVQRTAVAAREAKVNDRRKKETRES